MVHCIPAHHFLIFYPHNTLRNLWQTAKYIPAQKLLFEVLNLRRNADNYLLSDGTPDPLAPQGYSPDYVFASVMAANPLIWCEMQHLTEEDRASLASVIAEYKLRRDDFVEVIIKRSIAHQDKIIRRDRLSENTIHTLPEIHRVLLIVHRHQNRVIHS